MPKKSLGCILFRIITQLFSLLTCLYNMHRHHQSCSILSLEYNSGQKSNTQLGKGIQEGHMLFCLVRKEGFLSFTSFEHGLSKEPFIWGILASPWAAAVRAGSSCTAASPSGKAEAPSWCQAVSLLGVLQSGLTLPGRWVNNAKNFIKN